MANTAVSHRGDIPALPEKESRGPRALEGEPHPQASGADRDRSGPVAYSVGDLCRLLSLTGSQGRSL